MRLTSEKLYMIMSYVFPTNFINIIFFYGGVYPQVLHVPYWSVDADSIWNESTLFFSRKNDRVGVYLNHKTYVYVDEAIIKMFRTSIHQNMYHFNLIYGQS